MVRVGYADRAELEADIAFVAYLVLRYGDWIAPLLDRLENELQGFRQSSSAQDRAREALHRYSLPAVDLKAIL